MNEPLTPAPVWEPVEEASVAEPSIPRAPARKIPRWVVTVALALAGTLAQFLAIHAVGGVGGFSSGNVPEVVALGRDLAAGATLSAEDFSPVALTSESCSAQFVIWEKAQALVGRKLRIPVAAHEPMARGVLVAQSLEAAFPDRIPLGKRLFVLNAQLGVLSGVLKRGDRIDVVGNLELPGKGFVTKTLLSGAVVVALGAPGKTTGSDNALSLYLDPRDVEFLVHAQRFGTLSVVLRNPGDGASEAGEDGMTETQFLNDKRIQDVYEDDLFQIQKGNVVHER